MYTVKFTAMSESATLTDSAARKTRDFESWKDAFNYYYEFAEVLMLGNVETARKPRNLQAGGLGYEFKINLICHDE